MEGPYKLLPAEQAQLEIWLTWPAGACTALPCPISKDFKQNINGILEAYPFTLCRYYQYLLQVH